MYKFNPLTLYSISVDVNEEEVPMQFEYLSFNSAISIGAHTRFTGHDGAAMINSKKLALEYIEALKVVYKKRYNLDFEFVLNMNETSSDYLSKKEIEKLESDSNIIRARLLTRNFAPNRKVDLSVLNKPQC